MPHKKYANQYSRKYNIERPERPPHPRQVQYEEMLKQLPPLDDSFVRDLMQIYEEEFGEPISYENCAKEAQQLLFLYRKVFDKFLPSELEAHKAAHPELYEDPPTA